LGGQAYEKSYIVLLPSLVPYGTGTPGCSGASTLSAKPFPRVNTPSFTLTTTNAPPSSLGLVLVCNAADEAGSDPFYAGVKLHVDPYAATEAAHLNATSDALGVGTAAAPIPGLASLVGKTYYAQSIWLWPSGSCQLWPFQLSSSMGLAVTIHP
jgi:hypothetical protein